MAVVVIGVAGVLFATTASGGPNAPLAPKPPAAQVTYTPAIAATDVDPHTKAAVTATGGKIVEVKLTSEKGGDVEGKISPDGTRWEASGPLRYGATYQWLGAVEDPDGTRAPLQGIFTTKAPTKTVRGTLNIGDGRTVGIAAPIRIQFNAHVDDRAAVEKALKVTTPTPIEGSWGWLPDEGGGSRVDYRPKDYWPANTQVKVEADLEGVDYGGGAVGAADVSSTFTIGRAQIVKADVNSFRMIVLRDGKQVMDLPASYGLGADPERNTRSGIHVVTEKFTDKRMVSERYRYDVMEKWAVRISNNGEFIHANPVSAAAQGSSNVTHGCVNLSIDNARAYYDTALYGDPVEVTGTPVQLGPKDGDIWDWTVPWAQWKTMSALD
ncbi:L,D-transpeptidase [Pseudonocardia sp. CA-107938]|uniref:L,D-transpeptidase n=1 Tax=Pseudonocardia sp. CA-107938 TaxID=3240021 RepID=UPI003D8B1BD3